MTDLPKIFTDYATTKGWRSKYVTLQDKEFQVSAATLTSGEFMLLIFPFAESAVIGKIGIVDYWRATTRLWLGRKFDTSSSTGTLSSIDETLAQKDERRLTVIRAALKTLIKDLFCKGDYDLLSSSINIEINMTNESMDFVVMDLTFKSP